MSNRNRNRVNRGPDMTEPTGNQEDATATAIEGEGENDDATDDTLASYDRTGTDPVRDLAESGDAEEETPRAVVAHPELPCYRFAEDVDVMAVSEAENTPMLHPIYKAARGKPLVLYAVQKRGGAYDAVRGYNVDKRVPGAVVISFEDYKRYTGACENE